MTRDVGRDGPHITIPVVIRDELGLHARPAARLAQAAQGFESEILLYGGQGVADAKSILDILSLAAGFGSRLTLECRGEDAQEAAEALRLLFESPLIQGQT